MIYITGDTHGDFSRFDRFCKRIQTTTDDMMIVLGDVGLNYFGDERDQLRKEHVAKYPLTFFCIHGNHEMRPTDTGNYKTKDFRGGTVWVEDEYPNILFAKDGDAFRFAEKNCIVIGGAYSVDKYYRLARSMRWFENEQPSPEIKAYVEKQIATYDHKFDVVLSHTSPLKYEPIEVFLPMIDQSSVDKSTEEWLDTIEERLDYRRWYCGHYHTSKRIDKIQFMFEDIDELC